MLDPGGDSSSSSSSGGSWKRKVGAAGKSLSRSGEDAISESRSEAASKIGPVSMRKGGKVRKSKRKARASR